MQKIKLYCNGGSKQSDGNCEKCEPRKALRESSGYLLGILEEAERR